MSPESCRKGGWQKCGKWGGRVRRVRFPGQRPLRAGGRAPGSSHESSACWQHRTLGGGKPSPDSGQQGGPSTLVTVGGQVMQPQPTPASRWFLHPRSYLVFDFIFNLSSLIFSFSFLFIPSLLLSLLPLPSHPCLLLCLPFLLFSFNSRLLEYSCFIMLCYCLLYSKVNQLYVYIHPLFFGFPSHLGHHRTVSTVPWTICRFSLVPYFIHCLFSLCLSLFCISLFFILVSLPWHTLFHSLSFFNLYFSVKSWQTSEHSGLKSYLRMYFMPLNTIS